jgi:hypothetical protein
VAVTELAIRGRGANAFEAAWVGELDAGRTVPLTRPGGNEDWRVTIEEWEMLEGDPPSPVDVDPGSVDVPVWERRLVYADRVRL